MKGFVNILIAVVSIAIFVGAYLWSNYQHGNFKLNVNAPNLNIPSCPKSYSGFTSPLTEDDKLESIAPLGNLNPGGGHLLLTDHMHFLLKGKILL